MIELVCTGDGSHTIFVPDIEEHYHSVHGAVQESEYIFVRNGFNFCKKNNPVNIFEAGFGTGLNALLTAVRAVKENRIVHYLSIEKYPLPEKIIRSLNYKEFIPEEYGFLFEKIQSAAWNISQKITSGFTLKKIKDDLLNFKLKGLFDLIYFDAFAPDKQPEMWTPEILGKMSDHLAPEGILVTYSAKGEVKRNLKRCGLEVELLSGPPGKRQFIQAKKIS